MARGGRKLPGRGGHRGRLRGGRRGGHRGRPSGAHRGGHHHAEGHGRGHHQGGARRGWPAGPGKRRLRGLLRRQRPHSRVGLFPGMKRKTKSAAARDDMNFVDEANKPSAAMADAIEAGSSTSSEEYVQGPPLKLEEDKIRQEEEARKQKEAEEMRLMEEEARWLKEAQEQERKRKESRRMEKARKHKEHEEKKPDEKEQDDKKQDEKKEDERNQDEEAVRRRKEKDPKENDDEEARFRRMEQRKEEEEDGQLQEAQKENEPKDRRLRDQLVDEDEDALQRLQDRRKEEEEKIRLLKEERKRVDEESAIRRLEQERKLLEAQRVTAKAPTTKDAPRIEKTESISPITRQIMDVVNDIEKMTTNPERPAMVEASTETVDIPSQRPQQVRMPEYDVQTAPMMRPVASYVIKRPRSETRLQRLLSFFGLASPQEPDQEVIEYSFIEPTARWSPYEEQQDRPVRYGVGYQRQRKTRRQGEYDESPESSDSEGSPDELEEKGREDDTCKRRKKRSGRKKKSTQRRDAQKDGGTTFGKTAEAQMDQMDKPKVNPTGVTGASTQRVSGMGYVEEITEEIMQPPRNVYGQPIGPRLRRMRVVRPLDTVSGSTALRQVAQPSSTSDWKARAEPAIDELWTRTHILPPAEQADTERVNETDLQHEFTAQAFYPANSSGEARRPQSVPCPPRQLQPPLMSRTLGSWNIRKPFPAGHGYYGVEQVPYCQAHYSPPRPPLEQPAQYNHMKLPQSTSMNSVCTCVVKCGDHCIGLGRRKSEFLEPSKPSLRSSTSVYEYENARLFEDTAPIYREPSLRAEGRQREDLEARIRAEEEARLLRSKLRLLEAGRYEEKARFDELRQEEQALQRERQLLEGELNRLRERRQADQWRQRQDLGMKQIYRIQERLRLLEQERNDARKCSLWTREEVPTSVPIAMPWHFPVSPYGLPTQHISTDYTAPWSRQRGRHAHLCSNAGSESSESGKHAAVRVPGGQKAGREENEVFAWNTKNIFEKGGNSAREAGIPFLGSLIPFFSSTSSLADKPSGKHVSYRQEPSEPKFEPKVGVSKVMLENQSREQESVGKVEKTAASQPENSTGDKASSFDNPLSTVPQEPEVSDVVFVKYRKAISPAGMNRKRRLPSPDAISSDVDTLLSGLSETDHYSLTLARQKAKTRKGHKGSEKRGTDSSSNTFSDSSSAVPVQHSKASIRSNRSVNTSPQSKPWWSLSSASSRLFGVLMSTSPKKDSVPKVPSVRQAPSIAPRKSKAVPPQKPPDESSEDFMNQMTGDSAENPRQATSKTAELDSLRIDDVAEYTVKSKSADSNNALPPTAPKPPTVAVRSKISKHVTKATIENVEESELKSLENSSAENPLPLPDLFPDASENNEQLVQSAPKMNPRIPEITSTRRQSGPRSEIKNSTGRNGSVIVCNVPMACTDEIEAEKELFEIKETPQDLFPERGFVSLVSLLTILWITIVLSTTTFLSPKLKGDVPTGTTAFTRSPASSFTQPRTSASRTTNVASFYVCDSDYCAQEGNFLKSLLSEAEYPCEDFYDHICQRWTQRRSAEATRGGTISEDVFLEDRKERILLSSFKDNAAAVKPAAKFIRACKNSASSPFVDEVREVFKHWRIRKWPVRSYEERHREDAWLFAGELLRDMGLPVLANIYVAVDPFNARKGVTTLKPAEPLQLPRGTQSDLVDRALKETLRAFNLNDHYHIERLTYEIMMVFDEIERLADDDENAIVIRGCELQHDVFKLLSAAVDNKPNRTRSLTCKGIPHVQLLSVKYFRKLPEELRRFTANALLNHLGFRALVRLAAFMPDSLRALRELSYLEITGRSEVPDIDSLCLRAMEAMLPLCLVKAAALPLIYEGTALWQRRWLSDLEVAFLQALPRVPWLDERALFALAFRLRRIRVDPPFSIDQVQENAECLPADLVVGNTLADILGLFRELRTRRSILELRYGPDWHPLSPLRMWPHFDAGLRRVGIPQGLLNDSVPANSSIFAFHLARVAVRFYASMVPLLYSSFEYDREAALDLGPDSKRVLESARRCLEDDWRALSKRDAEMVPLPYSLLDDRAWWLRRWLLEQTLAIELALHAFRELLDVRRIWKLQYRFVTLPEYTSTQLFFMYYALDHCQKDYEGFERRQFLQRKRPPAKMRVNLPLRHVGAFADAFGCKRGDQMIANEPCTMFLH